MIPEWEQPDEAWPNEDDRFFAEAMESVLNQALEAELDFDSKEYVRSVTVLLARTAVELGAIRQILDARLKRGPDDSAPWK